MIKCWQKIQDDRRGGHFDKIIGHISGTNCPIVTKIGTYVENDQFWKLSNFGEKNPKMAAVAAIYIKLLDISLEPLD